MIFEEPLKWSIDTFWYKNYTTMEYVIMNWIGLKSYLTNRKQITGVNNIKSSEITNGYGVTQGSNLGALLFIIYTNDMPNEIGIYADNTLIFNISETDEECQINLKFDLNNVNKCSATE